MRFNSLAVLGALVSTAYTKKLKCTNDFQGTQLELQAAQQDAFVNFAGLFLVQRDIQQAFDLYIPGCVSVIFQSVYSRLTNFDRHNISMSPYA